MHQNSAKALDEEYRIRKGKGKGEKGSRPTRQYRARTPPPTAKMIAMGRLQKPIPSREADFDWRGNQNRVNSRPASKPPEWREKAKAAKGGKDGKGARKAKGEPATQGLGLVQLDLSVPNQSVDDQEELIPEPPPGFNLNYAPERAETPELDEDSEDSNAVPSFLFDSSP